MKRVIVGLVVVALGLTIGAPVVESRQWDPENPPPWIPVTAVPNQPIGEEGPWIDVNKRACVTIWTPAVIIWKLDWLWLPWLIQTVSLETETVVPEDISIEHEHLQCGD